HASSSPWSARMPSTPWGPRKRSRSGPVNTDRSLGRYRSASGALASVTSPLCPVLVRLAQADRVQEVTREVRVQSIPKHRRKVLRGRDNTAQPVDVHIEVAVI